jgi:hypothetical protein
MRWSTTDFFAALAHATAGQMRGELENQQRQQLQQQQRFDQQLGLAKLMQGEQERADANTRAVVPLLESGQPQADALGSLFNRPSPFAGLRSSPLVQQRPDLAAQLPPAPTPRGLPGGMASIGTGQTIPRPAQQPLPPRGFRGPGGAVLTTKGVSKEQMAALRNQLAEASKGLEDYAPAATDPADQARITGLLQSIRGLDTSTAEGYAEGRRLASEAGLFAKYGRAAAQRLEAAKLRETADQEAAVGKEIRAHLAELNPLSITPAGVRGLYKNWKGKDYSHLIKDVPDAQLPLGDARLWDRRGQITGQLASQVNVDPKTQGVLLSELRMINKRLGIEEEPVPASIQKRPPPAEEVAAEKRRAAEELRRVEDEKRRAAAEKRAAARHLLEMAKIRKETEKKTEQFTRVQLEKLEAAEQDLARARVDRKSAGVDPARVDLSSPRPENPRMAARWDMAQREVEAEMRLYHTRKALGLNPTLPNQSMWRMKKPPAAKPPPPPESPAARLFRGAVEGVKGLVAGDQPVTRERRAKIIQDLRRLDPTVTQAEINAELRRRNLLPAR